MLNRRIFLILSKDNPEDIQLWLGKEGETRGGQRQRIGIARALVQESCSQLVFDEATSSLDNETEQGVMDSIRKPSQGSNCVTDSPQILLC